MIYVAISVKIRKNMYAKKIIFGILLHAVVEMVNIQEVLLTIQLSRVIRLKKKH